MPRPFDTTDLRAANAVMRGVAEAYGYRPGHDRDADDLCECGHHRLAHHGATATGRCDDCDCPEFRYPEGGTT